jgi:cytochrome c5
MQRPWHASAALLAAVFVASAAQESARPPIALNARQEALLLANCTQCHARPGIGAPLIGDAAAWKERRYQGEDRLLEHVVLGVRGMPPLGYCSACTEDDFRALIRYMAGVEDKN